MQPNVRNKDLEEIGGGMRAPGPRAVGRWRCHMAGAEWLRGGGDFCPEAVDMSGRGGTKRPAARGEFLGFGLRDFGGGAIL